MSFVIRAAVAADQRRIRWIVWTARINPLALHWRRFLVAEAYERVIGVGQIRLHGDGSRELASLAVIPAWQGHGVGGALVRALLARERNTLYLMCEDSLERYYTRFGFVRVYSELPPYFQRIVRVADFAARIVGRGIEPSIMRWEYRKEQIS